MDALFGLPRKRSAGISYKEPLLGNIFFGEQASVDQFVAESNKSKSMSTVSLVLCITMICNILIMLQACNDFLAGNMFRSAHRYSALDETALFGCACHHEFPGCFINLKHGER